MDTKTFCKEVKVELPSTTFARISHAEFVLPTLLYCMWSSKAKLPQWPPCEISKLGHCLLHPTWVRRRSFIFTTLCTGGRFCCQHLEPQNVPQKPYESQWWLEMTGVLLCPGGAAVSGWPLTHTVDSLFSSFICLPFQILVGKRCRRDCWPRTLLYICILASDLTVCNYDCYMNKTETKSGPSSTTT